MIQNIRIENYKSIEDIRLDLGRVNVFIGENGAGKSNILEAIALAAAAEAGKLDNEFLSSRGIRVSGADLMRSAFKTEDAQKPISITAEQVGRGSIRYELTNDNKPYSSWSNTAAISAAPVKAEDMGEFIRDLVSKIDDESERRRVVEDIFEQLKAKVEAAFDIASRGAKERKKINLSVDITVQSRDRLAHLGGMVNFDDFVIYSPENSSLRAYEKEGQIEPLGINGEGLFKFLEVSALSDEENLIDTVKDALRLFGWFVDFDMDSNLSNGQMKISDHFLNESGLQFDQRSANEGFLFIAFYFSLLSSKLTPSFFAIDNVDASLNPKLCEELMRRLAQMTLRNDKQVILTTHNPALLDGLDLTDPEQRLFVVSRKRQGQTQVRRFKTKPTTDKPSRLSELFVRGTLGGLPKSF